MDVTIVQEENIEIPNVTKVKICTAFDMFTNKIEVFQGKKKTTYKECDTYDVIIKSTDSKKEPVDFDIIDKITEDLLLKINNNSVPVTLDDKLETNVVTTDFVTDVLHEIIDTYKEKLSCGK